MELQDIHKAILAECAYDDVGLWAIVWDVNQGPYGSEARLPEWVRQKTIETIRDLLQSGLIEAGNPNGPKFQSVSSSVDETIAYIEREWDRLGRAPNIGDVCWFRATPAGEQLAHELNLRA
jgi:hypothetical protein